MLSAVEVSITVCSVELGMGLPVHMFECHWALCTNHTWKTVKSFCLSGLINSKARVLHLKTMSGFISQYDPNGQVITPHFELSVTFVCHKPPSRCDGWLKSSQLDKPVKYTDFEICGVHDHSICVNFFASVQHKIEWEYTTVTAGSNHSSCSRLPAGSQASVGEGIVELYYKFPGDCGQ